VVGIRDGDFDGASVVGNCVGANVVGLLLGDVEGMVVVGNFEGGTEGVFDGFVEGHSVGLTEGGSLGSVVEGKKLGAALSLQQIVTSILINVIIVV